MYAMSMKMNTITRNEKRIAAYELTVAASVRLSRLEKKMPSVQKKTAVTTSINSETINSPKPTPPNKNARLCRGTAVRTNRKM